MIAKFSQRRLQDDILREAKILGMHMGTAELIAKKVTSKTRKWMKDRGTITEDDLTRVVSRELSRYNKDLAFMYKNRGKII